MKTMLIAAMAAAFVALAVGVVASGGASSSVNDGTTTTEDVTQTVPTQTVETVEDISGPCDEAEHANDPRCTGVATPAAPAPRIDNSGPGSMNSGPGSVHSGRGHG